MTQDFMERIADALDRMSPRPPTLPNLETGNAFLWHAEPDFFETISDVECLALELLVGIDRAKIPSLKIRSNLRKACLLTMLCYGVREEWGSRHW